MIAMTDRLTAWQPMDSAPTEPFKVVPPHDTIAWSEAYGPELALLCWNHDAPTLIRAAWHTRDGGDGQWWDLDFGDVVDVRILGWTLLPSPEEFAAMVEGGNSHNTGMTGEVSAA